MTVQLREMNASDIEAGLRLCRAVGWNQLESDWRCFLDWNPLGCLVAVRDGVVVGTVATLRFEGRFGWISMVLAPICTRIHDSRGGHLCPGFGPAQPAHPLPVATRACGSAGLQLYEAHYALVAPGAGPRPRACPLGCLDCGARLSRLSDSRPHGGGHAVGGWIRRTLRLPGLRTRPRRRAQ